MRGWTKALLASVSVVLIAGMCTAQEEPVDKARKLQIIDSVTTKVNERYIFPEVAKKMEAFVRKQFKSGAYDKATDLPEFLSRLSMDMREVSKDGHFGIAYEPDPPTMSDSITPEMIAAEKEEHRRNNYGFDKIGILPGNIGYIKFDGFSPAEWGGQAAAAALAFVENTDAVIFDLRENGGGEPSMIQFISSYLFDQPTHLNSFAERGSDSIQQFWTSAFIPGKRMPDVPVYILTSKRTFSAAEEFTYNLKNLKRAKIVGETTGGGAHPVGPYFFKDLKVVVMIPYARAINPITGDNWEGKGVEPDIAVPANEALFAAQKQALVDLEQKLTDPDKRRELKWVADALVPEGMTLELTAEELSAYVGVYGPRTISLEDGQLYSQREGGPKFKIYPLTQDLFAFEGPDYVRLRFQRNESGAITGVLTQYVDGREETMMRSSSN